MKTLKKLFALFTFTMAIYSCSSDDDANKNLAEEQNNLEEAAIDITNLNSGISIVGATKKAGLPPTPNSNLNLDITSSDIEGYQKAGFNLKFSTTENNIAGAYIIFKDLNGNPTSNYFDIPVSSFKTADDNKGFKNKKTKISLKSNKTKADGEYEIDIDFNDSIPPGQFCADIFIYDNQNNISQIVPVCIEVEAWGGNSSIVGEWIYEPIPEDYGTTLIECQNGQSFEAPYDEYIKSESIFKIKDDGTFQVDDNEEYKTIDLIATENNCNATYTNEISKYHTKIIGKWAFNEKNKTLTLIAFKYNDFIMPSESEDFPNGELVFDGYKVEIINGKLVITEDQETFPEIYTFKRK